MDNETIINSPENKDAIIRTHSESGTGSVNSHWIETAAEIIVIDAQRTLSSANGLLEKVSETGKPIVAVCLTHSHPDHFGGWRAIADRFPQAQFFSSQATLDGIKADRQGFIKLAKGILRDDFSDEIPHPIRIVNSGEEIVFGNLKLLVDEIGAGEAEAMTMFYLASQKTLFTGDLIANQMTPLLTEGRTGAWLKQIETIAAKYAEAETILPGHGQSGAARELLNAQKKYLQQVRSIVSRELENGKTLTDANKKAAVKTVERLYPGYFPVAEIPDFIALNVDAVARELNQ